MHYGIIASSFLDFEVKYIEELYIYIVNSFKLIHVNVLKKMIVGDF